MTKTARTSVMRAAVVMAVVGWTSHSNAAEFFQFLDIETLVAVRLAVEGATTRLARPGCQDLFADFADQSGQRLSTRLVATGKPPADAVASLRFIDDRGARQCRSSGTLAFTRTGSWFIRVCGEQFRHAFSTESHGDRDHRDSRVPACSWTRRESTHQ